MPINFPTNTFLKTLYLINKEKEKPLAEKADEKEKSVNPLKNPT